MIICKNNKICLCFNTAVFKFLIYFILKHFIDYFNKYRIKVLKFIELKFKKNLRFASSNNKNFFKTMECILEAAALN